MTMTSKYLPAWELLKRNQELKVIIKVPKDATRELKERRVLAFRKAISRRKELDREFMLEFPSAKLLVANVDWESMEVTIQLTNMPYDDFFIPSLLSTF